MKFQIACTQGSDLVDVRKPDGTTYIEHAIDVVDHREHLAAALGTIPYPRRIARFIPDPFFIRGQKSAIGIILIVRECVEKRLRTKCSETIF